MKIALASLASVACVACVRWPNVPPELRDSDAQLAAAVRVDSRCGHGSGVLINDRRVVTALHVVDCRRSGGSVEITLPSGRRFMAAVDRQDRRRDLARIEIFQAGNFQAGIAPVVLGTATVGSAACTANMLPRRGGACGRIGAANRQRFELAARTARGNSGGGVYSSGRLIGITLQRYASGFGLGQAMPPEWLAY